MLIFYNKKCGAGDLSNKLSSATLKKIHNIIYSALDKAVSERLIYYNVWKKTIPPKLIKKEVRALTKDEQDTFVKTLSTERLGPAFMLNLFAGLRRGELLGLTWEDVDLDKGIIIVKQALVSTRVFGEEKRQKSLYKS